MSDVLIPGTAVPPPAGASPAVPPVVAASTPNVPSDDTPITLQVDGQLQTKPFAEWKSSMMLGAAATKRFQEAAEVKRQAEALHQELASREETVRSFLQNPTQVRQYLQMLESQATGSVPQGVSPEQPVTMSQLSQLVQAMRAEQAQALQSERATLTTSLTKERIAEAAQTTIGNVIKQNPILQSLPKADVWIRQIAADTPYTSITEMVEGLNRAANQVLGMLKQNVQTAQQSQTQVAQALASQGTEPPGGSGVMPAPQSRYNAQTRKADWNAISQDAKAWVEGRLRTGG